LYKINISERAARLLSKHIGALVSFKTLITITRST